MIYLPSPVVSYETIEAEALGYDPAFLRSRALHRSVRKAAKMLHT